MADDFTALSPTVIRERVDAAGLNRRARARAIEDEAHAYLRTAIVTGVLGRAARIPPERELAAEFGANRRSIRQALERLAREGLIVRRVGSGSTVTWAPPSVPDGQVFETPAVSPLDVLEACRALEPNICDLVVARATEADFANMAARLREMQTARDQVTFKEAGFAFHLEVARATRNPLLVRLYEIVVAARAKAGWGTLIPLNDRKEQRDHQIAANRSLLEALRARDAAAARQLSLQHRTQMISTAAAFPLHA